MVHDLEGTAFIEQVATFHAYRRSFFLNPDRWNSSRVSVELDWQEVKFESSAKNSIPEQKGIYAFVVRHINNHFPPHGYIMYVGITGGGDNNRTLRNRFGDYLYEQKRNKRPRLHLMLQQFQNNLFFNFVPIPEDSPIDLAQLEIDLNDAIVPPVGRKDFSAEIKAIRDALQ